MGYFDFAVPDFYGAPSAPSGGYSVPSFGSNYDLPGAGWDPPVVDNNPWYETPSLLPMGSTDIGNRSNNTWWGVDQSKITATLSDVLGSVVQAGAKTAINAAAGSINSAANGKPSGLQALAANFRSTATGVQINAGAQAFSIQNFFANPIVWFALVGGVILLFVLRR